MGAKALADLIGCTGRLRTAAEGFVVPIRVDDARVSFGRVDVLVTPLAGDGSAWVTLDRVVIEKEVR